MAYNDAICGTPSVDCNTSHLSLEQILRSLIKQDANGCLFVPSGAGGGGAGGGSQTLIASTTEKTRTNATTTYLNARPVFSDIASDAVFVTNYFTAVDKKGIINSGRYTFNDAINPQLTGINGYIHFFDLGSNIPALADGATFDVPLAAQYNYLGTMQMKSFEIENGSNVVSGMIEPIGSPVMVYNRDSTTNVYYVVELTNNIELNTGCKLVINLFGTQW